MAKVKAVIFDMDGTVANTLTSIAGFGNAALEAHRLKTFPVDRYRTFVGNGACAACSLPLRAHTPKKM